MQQSPTNAIINCVLAPLAIVGLFALGAAIDAAPDAREEIASAASLDDAQRQAKHEASKEDAAYALCKSEHGPNVAASWDAQGALVCQPKRGKAVIYAAHTPTK